MVRGDGIIKSTPTSYEHTSFGGFSIKARLTPDGKISLDINIAEPLRQQGLSKHLYREVLAHLKSDCAHSTFNDIDPNYKVNFEKYRENINNHMTREEALLHTPAGKVWRDLGYTQVTVISAGDHHIIADFRKPPVGAHD